MKPSRDCRRDGPEPGCFVPLGRSQWPWLWGLCSAFGFIFFGHSWWHHIFNRVKQAPGWWGQYNFVRGNRVRFTVSPDSSFNFVAYIVYKWRGYGHSKIKIPRNSVPCPYVSLFVFLPASLSVCLLPPPSLNILQSPLSVFSPQSSCLPTCLPVYLLPTPTIHTFPRSLSIYLPLCLLACLSIFLSTFSPPVFHPDLIPQQSVFVSSSLFQCVHLPVPLSPSQCEVPQTEIKAHSYKHTELSKVLPFELGVGKKNTALPASPTARNCSDFRFHYLCFAMIRLSRLPA